MTGESANVRQLLAWIQKVSTAGWIWDIKVISANDTYAKPNVHQGGPYISKALLDAAFPVLSSRVEKEDNPDLQIPTSIDSHDWSGAIRLVWYNSKIFKQQKNGRNEARLTGWGGRESPMLEPNATGTLSVIAFRRRTGKDADLCYVWLCRDADEADVILDMAGDVDPGRGVLYSPQGGIVVEERAGTCTLSEADLPPAWLKEFPSGEEILDWVLQNRPTEGLSPDDRLLRRRECEFGVFSSIEARHVLPRIKGGFESVDDFVKYAGGVLNRRKARSGRSLELQTHQILDEESIHHTIAPHTEGKRKPDLILPGITNYRNGEWPANRLRMLALKTTCKDRWRQVLNEAARIRPKHLLTLQEGVSQDQHKEMEEEGVILVVPERLKRHYPDEVQPKLQSLQSFIDEVRTIQ